MPNGTFQVYQYIARVFSAFFIILQLVILLDFVYIVNEYLLERDRCAFVLVVLTALLISGTIVGMGFLYKVRILACMCTSLSSFSIHRHPSHRPPLMQYWAPNSGCSLNIFFITWTLILFLVYGFISISPWRNQSAGLMTAAAVFAYCMYYTWSALQSEPRTNSDGTLAECVPSGSGGSSAIRVSFLFCLIV